MREHRALAAIRGPLQSSRSRLGKAGRVKKLNRRRSPRVKQGWHSGAGACPVEFWGRSTTPFAEGRGRGLGMDWARMLAYVTGTVDQELLARNEYLAAENRIMKAQ